MLRKNRLNLKPNANSRRSRLIPQRHPTHKVPKVPHKEVPQEKTLRDWLRVLTAGRQAYKLRYFNIHNQDDEADEE